MCSSINRLFSHLRTPKRDPRWLMCLSAHPSSCLSNSRPDAFSSTSFSFAIFFFFSRLGLVIITLDFFFFLVIKASKIIPTTATQTGSFYRSALTTFRSFERINIVHFCANAFDHKFIDTIFFWLLFRSLTHPPTLPPTCQPANQPTSHPSPSIGRSLPPPTV